MRVDILSLFPGLFEGFITLGLPRIAREKGLLDVRLTNIRDFADDARGTVDDRPFGGGPGMVLMCPPVFAAAEAAEADALPGPDGAPLRPRRIVLSPQGRRLDQELVTELASEPWLLLLCGHYEGFDERIRDGLKTEDISIGDYVLSGGEVPAMVLVDAVARLLPGALGDPDSARDDSFSNSYGGLEYPQYTRPREFRGMTVPDILLSGNHGAVDAWRLEQGLRRTRERRPDLLPPEERQA